MGRVLGSGYNDVAVLDVPAQDDLSTALAVFPAKPGKQRLFDQRLISVS